ncbi:Vacuolar protein sorting/targeting protein 10 [Thelohanellus kitauei]|uniref:Vacuolar protein sorting/targeting protein 10 n=1 Tax=Thelohanellus kitauei TaxID=669202 RepID=A0A0C2M9D3_THEKT|nr:Vacuolar protein sorting/targeting protein 10 [Thelohanellus kitauei]
MVILSKGWCSIVWSSLLIVCWSKNEKNLVVNPSGIEELPLCKNNTFHDESDSFEVIYNFVRPQFVLYFTKSVHKPGKGAIYKYDQSKQAFDLVNLKTPRSTANLSIVVPIGEKMFCLSTEDNLAFYINEDLQVEHEQKLLPEHEYVPNSYYPDLIARRHVNYTEMGSHVAFSTNYGKEYNHNFTMINKYDWVPKRRNIVFLTTGKNLTIYNIDKNDTYFVLSNVDDYKIAQTQLLIIQSTNGTNLNITIFDTEKSTHNLTHFPALLKIQRVKLFDYAFDRHYVILEDEHSNTCLWSPTDTPLYFVRKACCHMNESVEMESNFFINRNVEGTIYWNHLNDRNEFRTFTSTNDGRFWFQVNIRKNDTSQHNIATHFNFKLHDQRVVPDNLNWIDIQFGQVSNKTITFISQNNGQHWSSVPLGGSKIVFLNSGTVILFVAHDSRTVICSFDGAMTWFNYTYYKDNKTVLYAGKLPDNDLKAVIVTRDSLTSQLNFDILDFSNIFSISLNKVEFECKSDHYMEWALPRFRDSCYQGMSVLVRTRHPNVRCVDKMTEHKKVNSKCPCTSDDYACRYNYYSFGDECVLDELSGINEEPYKCDPGSHYAFYQAGYVKIPHDTCDPREFHLDVINNSSDLCVQNEWTDFLVLNSMNKIYVSQLASYGEYFRKQIITEIFPNKKASLGTPIAFDYSQLLIYNFKNNHLAMYPFHNGNKTDLYYLEDVVVNMVYDSALHAIIFLTTRKELRIVSLLTNFQQLVSDNVKRFNIHPLTRSAFDILQAYIDLEAKRVFILNSNNVLMIKKFVKDITDLQTFTEIPKVTNFVVYDYNLYHLVDGDLLYRNLEKINQSVKLTNDVKFDRILLHQKSLISLRHQCQNLNCQFMCVPVSYHKVQCECPPETIRSDDKCICPKEHPDCLLPHCTGFPCKNSKCLINNVQCNGVDDCGDGSDEIGCTHKCPKDNHLCQDKCITKDTVCNSKKIVVIPTKPKARKLGVGYIILIIILICLAMIYPSYLFIRWCRRRFYQRPLSLNPSHHLSQMELMRLLDDDNDLYDLS